MPVSWKRYLLDVIQIFKLYKCSNLEFGVAVKHEQSKRQRKAKNVRVVLKYSCGEEWTDKMRTGDVLTGIGKEINWGRCQEKKHIGGVYTRVRISAAKN